MKSTLKNAATVPLAALRRTAARRALKPLVSADLPQLRQVGAALKDTLGGGPDAADRARIVAIEARRAELASSKARIDVLDYGAGRPGDNRSDEEMRAGVLTTAAVADVCAASKPAFWAVLLYHLVRRLQPSSALELGTCVGISAAYQGVAMARNGQGRLRTLEGAPSIAALAQQTFDAVGLDNVEVVVGPFHETLSAALAAAAPLDFFFNDGHHDHDAVLRYFDEALPYLADGAVVVFDDISWSPGMRRAWTAIEAHPRVHASIDLRAMGITIIGSAPSPIRRNLRIPL